MQKTVTVDGQDLTLATITIGTLEQIDLAGKKGRTFNIALVAASILASGDTTHGTEEWVKSLPAFVADGEEPPFQKLLEAANAVNGFEAPKPAAGKSEPAAPAQG